jgi:hypothetical protein
MIRFGYRAEPPRRAAIPSTSAAGTVSLRPFVPIRVFGPSGRFVSFRHAVADTGSAETLFPSDAASLIKANLLSATSKSILWRGNSYPVRFAQVELEISTTQEVWHWPTTVGFTSAPFPFPLLGMSGFFEFFDASFLGDDNALELTTNAAFPGTRKLLP